MMLSTFDRRRAVSDWRDAWLLQVWQAVGEAARQARDDLERETPCAGLWNIYLDQGAFANPRVDRSMRRAMRPFLDRVRALAGAELAQIDPALGEVGVALWRIDLDRLLPNEPSNLPELSMEEDPFGPTGTAIAKTVIGGAFTVGTRIIAGPGAAVVAGVHTLADVAAPTFRHWVVNAGVKRLSEAWISGGRTGETVAGRIASLFEDAHVRAREILQ